MSDFDTNLDAKVVSTIEETDKKCPRCGGVMDYDPATGGLKCPYCDYEQEIKKEEEKVRNATYLYYLGHFRIDHGSMYIRCSRRGLQGSCKCRA